MLLLIDESGKLLVGQQLFKSEFVLPQEIGEDFDVGQSLQLGLVLHRASDQFGEVLQQSRVGQLSLLEQSQQTHRLISLSYIKGKGVSDPDAFDHLDQLFIGSLSVERGQHAADVALQGGGGLRVDQTTVDVLVQLHHVREVLLKFTETLAVLAYYFLLRGDHSLQLLQSAGIFLKSTLELGRGGLRLWLCGFLALALLFGEATEGFGQLLVFGPDLFERTGLSLHV